MTAPAVLANQAYGLFSDEVFTSTDLNRRSGEVLNHARKHPVTIARNNEQFALLRRDQAANLFQALGQIRQIVDVFQGALLVKVELPLPPAVEWIGYLDERDRISMLQEILGEYARASVEGDWEPVGDLIYEWRESALVIHSGVIEQALNENADGQTVTIPSLETEPEEVCALEK